jgi:hypothetical protein
LPAGGSRSLIGEHRRIVLKTYWAHGGVEIDAQGDAFFCDQGERR